MDYFYPSSRIFHDPFWDSYYRQPASFSMMLPNNFRPRSQRPVNHWTIFDNMDMDRDTRFFKRPRRGKSVQEFPDADQNERRILDSLQTKGGNMIRRNEIVERPQDFMVGKKKLLDENEKKITGNHDNKFLLNKIDGVNGEKGKTIIDGREQHKLEEDSSMIPNENYLKNINASCKHDDETNKGDIIQDEGNEVSNKFDKTMVNHLEENRMLSENQIFSTTHSQGEISSGLIQQQKNISEKLEIIKNIQNQVDQLAEKINNLTNDVKQKDFLYCEEMLTKYLLELDNVLANGEEAIRNARKSVVCLINENIQKLELLSSQLNV